MEIQEALRALGALAHEIRLQVFRLLIRQGPPGLNAGAIAEQLAVPPSTLSAHLAQLERAGLVSARRVDRRIFYALDIDGTRALLRYLTEDCCQGRTELCPILADADALCAP